MFKIALEGAILFFLCTEKKICYYGSIKFYNINMKEKRIRKSMYRGAFLSTLTLFPQYVFALTAGWTPDNYTGYGLSSTPIWEIIETLMLWLLYILGFIAIIAFVVAGLIYLTSGGDEKKAETAKQYVTWSIIGVVVALSGLIILRAVSFWLLGTTTDF